MIHGFVEALSILIWVWCFFSYFKNCSSFLFIRMFSWSFLISKSCDSRSFLLFIEVFRSHAVFLFRSMSLNSFFTISFSAFLNTTLCSSVIVLNLVSCDFLCLSADFLYFHVIFFVFLSAENHSMQKLIMHTIWLSMRDLTVTIP